MHNNFTNILLELSWFGIQRSLHKSLGQFCTVCKSANVNIYLGLYSSLSNNAQNGSEQSMCGYIKLVTKVKLRNAD